MKIKTQLLIIAALVGLSALIPGGCSSNTAASKSQAAPPPLSSQPNEASSALVKSSSGGSITIEARLLGHQDNSLVFEISMETHSVNLDAYDFRQLATLWDDKGNKYSPVDWTSAPGGHHRSGRLVFAHSDQSVKTLELVIRNVGIDERVLRWEV